MTVGGQRMTVVTETTVATVELRVPDVDRWWPIGHGAQPLYEVTVSATSLVANPVADRVPLLHRRPGAAVLAFAPSNSMSNPMRAEPPSRFG